MKRITPQIKAIADAHIKAKSTGNWDNPSATTKEEVLRFLMEGKTFSQVLSQIEFRYCSITSILLTNHFSHETKGYKSCIYKGFKTLLSKQVN